MVDNGISGRADSESVATEILRYLGDHPSAADTLEGITNWWVPRQRIAESIVLVRGALGLLEARGQIQRQRMPDGQIIYRLRREEQS